MEEAFDIFRNLKVVELAGVLAGPSAGHFFAELGATVVKVENPGTGGDVTRSWKLKTEDPGDDTSAYFWSVNGGKQVVMLDLCAERDRAKLHALVKDADVVIANFKAGDDLKLGADYVTLSRIRPSLIYASLSGFGPDSPRAAYDLVLQAESGWMSMNGEPGSRPLKLPVALIDVIAGHQLKEAILVALLKRERTGKGSHVHVSLFASAVASLANQATNWLVAGHLPRTEGSLHPNIAPYGEIFETRDGVSVTFAIGTNRHFESLCRQLGCATLAGERAYRTNQSRVANRQQLYALLYDRVRDYQFADLFARCGEEGIPVARIRNLREVFALPEAQAMLRRFRHGDREITTVSGIAFSFQGS